MKTAKLYFKGAKYYDELFNIFISDLPEGYYELPDGKIMIETKNGIDDVEARQLVKI